MSDVQLRKAAIRLACIHPDDRSWVLSQLSSDERKRLTALIDEAAALGLTTDAAVVDAVLSESSGRLGGDDNPNASIASDRIARLGEAFWVALVLQRHGVKVPDELLPRIDSAAIRSWSERLDTESLPVALIDELYVISDAEFSERA
ncbi:hypothetical protein [Halopseudomonas sp.]|uniref:hypothetical protein n=1 Tax=Halopseudomonas sp. TaxID=2901191 RepID=UPI0030030E65